jgi:hypothetical protein
MSICNRNRIVTGLRFLFRVTLRRLDLAEEVYHIREPQKLPLVMSVDEISGLRCNVSWSAFVATVILARSTRPFSGRHHS